MPTPPAQMMDEVPVATNPYVSNPAPASTPTAAPVVQQLRSVARQQGIPVPEVADRLPVRQVGRVVPAWWLGAHGGAGETSLAALVPDVPAAGHAWPLRSDGGASSVLLVARSHPRGLLAAQRAAQQYASGEVPASVQLLGLVVIADAPGRLPQPVRTLYKRVAGAFPAAWLVPWSEAWRAGEEPRPGDAASRQLHKILSALQLTNVSKGPQQ